MFLSCNIVVSSLLYVCTIHQILGCMNIHKDLSHGNMHICVFVKILTGVVCFHSNRQVLTSTTSLDQLKVCCTLILCYTGGKGHNSQIKGRDSDVATGINYGVASSSSLSNSLCDYEIYLTRVS